jgi:perosamine synthetase
VTSGFRIRRPASVPHLHLTDLLAATPGARWNDLIRPHAIRYTYNGRAAIFQYLSMLRSTGIPAERRVVLIPAFHCPTVVDPVLHAGFEVRFYAVGHDLKIVRSDLLGKIDRTVAAAIFIRYFGFTDSTADLYSACREAGARVIDDCSHSFLSANPLRPALSGADATTYSFWKLLPTVAGGGVVLTGGDRDAAWCRQRRPSTRDSVARVRSLAGQLLEGQAGTRTARPTGTTAGTVDDCLDAEPSKRLPAAQAYPYDRAAAYWRIPASARPIIARADLQRVVDVRRRNFADLASALLPTPEISPVYPRLDPDTCPWGFPVLMRNRPERDFLLRARGVPVFTFGEVLHPLLFEQQRSERTMIDNAEFLANSILAIAIHQDLERSQIADVARVTNEFAAAL